MGIGALRRHHAARFPSATPGATSPGGGPDDTWTVKQLKAYAAEREIDLTGATKKLEILECIVAAQPPAEASEGGRSDEGEQPDEGESTEPIAGEGQSDE